MKPSLGDIGPGARRSRYRCERQPKRAIVHTGIPQRPPRGARPARAPWQPNLATEDSVRRSKMPKLRSGALGVHPRPCTQPDGPPKRPRRPRRAQRACVSCGPLASPPWWPRRVHDSDAMAGRVRTDWLGQNTHTQPLTVPNVRPLTRRGLVQHGWRVVRRTSRGARRGHAGGTSATPTRATSGCSTSAAHPTRPHDKPPEAPRGISPRGRRRHVFVVGRGP